MTHVGGGFEGKNFAQIHPNEGEQSSLPKEKGHPERKRKVAARLDQKIRGGGKERHVLINTR